MFFHGLAAGLAVEIREYWFGVHGHVRLSDLAGARAVSASKNWLVRYGLYGERIVILMVLLCIKSRVGLISNKKEGFILKKA